MNNIPYFEIYKEDNKWHWRCKAINNIIIARGRKEGYSDKWGCVGSVKRLITVLRTGVSNFEIRSV